MPTISIDIPAKQATRVTHALCQGKAETAVNAKETIIDYIKQIVRTVERQEAEKAALVAIPAPTDVTPT